jgi:sulfite exporter TauE/SafE/copper chaperone CopZ
MKKNYKFHVQGMHCKACVLLTESELLEIPNIVSAKTNLSQNTVEIVGDFGDKSEEVVAGELSAVLQKHGYSLSVEKPKINNSAEKNWSDFKIAVPIALAFIILFFLLQKFGLVNLVGGRNVSYGTAFTVGIIASLSTCMAVVGGLVLSMSATFAKEGDKVRPQVLFHLGRILSFFILGGVIGAIGSAFTLNLGATFALDLIIGLVMLILGINLLDVFHFSKKLQPSMPKFLSKHALGVSRFNHTLTPLLVGIATFFLPCGFTQSMQLYALTTGSFLSGGLTMLSFALGTLPVLALVSFSSFSIQKSSKSGVFFKTAGLVVIIFALFNLINSLVVVGIIPPIFNF